MADTIYIENAVRDHPRSRAILQRMPRAKVIGIRTMKMRGFWNRLLN